MIVVPKNKRSATIFLSLMSREFRLIHHVISLHPSVSHAVRMIWKTILRKDVYESRSGQKCLLENLVYLNPVYFCIDKTDPVDFLYLYLAQLR